MYLTISFILLLVLWRIYYSAGIYHIRLSLCALPQPPVDSFYKVGLGSHISQETRRNLYFQVDVRAVQRGVGKLINS